LNFSQQIFEKYSNAKFHENSSSGSRVISSEWTEGQTDRNDEVKGAFRNFAKVVENNLVKRYICSTTFYGTETWTLRKIHQKCLESFVMRCWRRMERISYTDRVENKVLHRAKEEKEHPAYNKAKEG
jgi:hypothetical protein